MVKRWKASSIVLSTLLVSSLTLGACGNSNNSDSGNTSKTSSSSPTADGKTEQLTVAFLGIGTMTDVQAVQDEISKITKEKINATVKLMPIDVSAWTQQTNLLLAGNEPLDLMVTSSFFNYSTQVAKNQLLPLDDLLEKYGQDMKNTMEPTIYNGTKINGKIYGVPSVRDTAADYGFIARKDLVDKYHIDLSKVKSYEDLEPIFKIIKDNEPGVNPLVQRSQTGTIANEMLTSRFDPLGEGLGVLPMDSGDLKIVNLFETQEYKDALSLARKWYKAGYIMQDAATTQEGNNALVKAGKAFGYFSNMKPGFESQEAGLNGYEMSAVRLTPPISQSTSATSFMLSIPKNTRDADRAMQLMNLLYTDKDVVNLLDNGIEGKHYVKDDQGQIKKPDGVESGWVFNQWEVGNNSLASVWEGTAPDIWDQMKAFNKAAKFSPALGFTFDANPVKTEIAAVTNVTNQYKVGLESGSLDPAVLPEFVSKLKAAGLDKIMAEKQKQLDAWAAANGK
ncbi:ABC transporter substrate-binding protein [Cohnella sp. REN36]|uniref:ABC transporter substrate-binding protein n=1 Tax=Cohnella sp. REN36 TaxID=2887347 RepID=UPI001D157A63|nr:ABC transporter substrate-binding protein [Cohnella sp. REN36]MCC3374471.1 ABC transporter substrate-binding protein [Cohnella sp. REN36]